MIAGPGYLSASVDHTFVQMQVGLHEPEQESYRPSHASYHNEEQFTEQDIKIIPHLAGEGLVSIWYLSIALRSCPQSMVTH